MRSYSNAVQGLTLLFIGEIVSIIGAVLSLLPIVGPIILIIAQVLILVGLNQAGKDDEGYRTAFLITIVNLVVNIINLFVSSTFSAVLDIIASILGLAVVYYVVTTTGNLAHSRGNDEVSAKGKTVWTLYLICTVVGVVVSLLSLFSTLLAAVLGIVLIIVQLVAYILYLIFLNKASKALA